MFWGCNFIPRCSCQGIAYAVSYAACNVFHPRNSYELVLKGIGNYLKATHGQGLLINPSSNLKIDCFPDANFVEMYDCEKVTDPAFVKSSTGYVVTVADCPILAIKASNRNCFYKHGRSNCLTQS